MLRTFARRASLGVLALVGALSFSSGAKAQGIAVPSRTVTGTVNGIMRPIAGATITVCAGGASGIPCSPALASTLFSNAALTQAVTNPTVADANGNYPQIFIGAGLYTVTESASGFTGFSYQLSVTCMASGGTCSVANLTATTSLTVAGVPAVTTTATQTLTNKTLTAPTITSATFSGTNSHSGTETFTGLLQCKNLNNVRCVSSANGTASDQGWTGTTWGAWINSADADLGVAPGEIWVVPVSATVALAAAVTISTNHTLRFFPGTYTTTSTITLSGATTLLCENPQECTLTQLTTNTNLVVVNGSDVVVKGMRLVQTGSGTGDTINAVGAFSRLRIINNSLESGNHNVFYSLLTSAQSDIWVTDNKVVAGGIPASDSSITIINLQGPCGPGPILSNVHVDRNIFANTVSHAAQIYSSLPLCISNATFEGNIAQLSAGAGLWGSGINGIVFSGNLVNSTGNECIDIERSKNISITGNTCTGGSTNGISVIGLNGAGAVNTTCSLGCTITANTLATVTPAAMTNINPMEQLMIDVGGVQEWVTVTTQTATTFTAFFKQAHTGAFAITGAAAANATKYIVEGFTVSGNAVDGTAGATGNAAILATLAQYGSITGNMVRNTSSNGILFTVGGAGVLGRFNNVSITGNSIRSDALVTAMTGIRVDGGGTLNQMRNIIVTGNDIDNFPTGVQLNSCRLCVANPNALTNMTTNYALDSATSFQGRAAASFGLPGVVAFQALNAALGATNIAVTPPTGMYQVCFFATTATAGTGTTGTVSLLWNDGNAKTFTSATWSLAAVDITGQVNGCQVIQVNSGSIQISTAGTFGTSTYNVWASAEQIQ